jgi:hypothetical protein
MAGRPFAWAPSIIGRVLFLVPESTPPGGWVRRTTVRLLWTDDFLEASRLASAGPFNRERQKSRVILEEILSRIRRQHHRQRGFVRFRLGGMASGVIGIAPRKWWTVFCSGLSDHLREGIGKDRAADRGFNLYEELKKPANPPLPRLRGPPVRRGIPSARRSSGNCRGLWTVRSWRTSPPPNSFRARHRRECRLEEIGRGLMEDFSGSRLGNEIRTVLRAREIVVKSPAC